jgi:hypothetical protein
MLSVAGKVLGAILDESLGLLCIHSPCTGIEDIAEWEHVSYRKFACV